ncbi:ABC transporter ATP-binding protein [Pseudodesulfovibrio alkaliphilus]|nr:ABC transporter ATP-binding protein [Pseudodesulfovibrio alkaliphilus]
MWCTVGLLLLAGVVESVGAISVVPLLTSLIGGETTSPLLLKINSTFLSVGVEPSLANILVVVSLAMVGRAGLFLFINRQVGYVEAEIATRLRTRLLDGVLSADWSYFTKQPIGTLTYCLSTECYQAGKALRILAQALSYLVQVLAYLAVAAFLSWKVLVAGLACGSLLLLCFQFLIRMIRRAGLKQASALNKMSAIFTDSLTGVKPLKVMNLEKNLIGHIMTQSERFRRAARKSAVGMGVLASIQEPFTTIMLAGGLYVGHIVLSMETAILLAMAFFFHRILTRVASFQQAFQGFGALEGVLTSLINKLNNILEHKEFFMGEEKAFFDKSIELRNVSLSYGSKQVLRDYSISIRMNSVTALCGPSGSGKTSTVDIMVGLVSPTAGGVYIDGVNMEALDISSWREQIGYVPQEVFLFNDSIRLNISLGRECSDEDIWAALEAAGARSFVELLPSGLDFLVGEHGRSLSGGQKQRLMIARALVARPRLLILDESTTGLDVKTEKEIWASVSAMKNNMAILAVSHQEAVIDVADVVVRIGGREG